MAEEPTIVDDIKEKVAEIKADVAESVGPLDDLYANKYRNQYLQFPSNIEGSPEERTWIRFDIQQLTGFKVMKAKSRDLAGDKNLSFLGKGVEKATALAKTAIALPINIATGVADSFLSDLPAGLGDIAKDFLGGGGQKVRGLGSIVLYAPAQQEISTGFSWDHQPAGVGGAGIQSALDGGGIKNNSTIDSMLKQFGRVATSVGGGSVVGASVGAGSEVGKTLVNRKAGAAFNNHLTAFFKGVNFRTMQFSFTLVPRNSGESRDIQKIIRLLKYAAAPASVDGEYGTFFAYPNVFDIEFHNENQTQKYLQSALTDIQVNYTAASQNATFYDKYPASVGLTLAFTELAIVNKQRVDEGY